MLSVDEWNCAIICHRRRCNNSRYWQPYLHPAVWLRRELAKGGYKMATVTPQGITPTTLPQYVTRLGGVWQTALGR